MQIVTRQQLAKEEGHLTGNANIETVGMSANHRQRMPNFTKEEEKVLIALASKYQKDIHCNGSNAKAWRHKKQTWQTIATEFANITKIERLAVKLRTKYESLRKSKKVPKCDEVVEHMETEVKYESVAESEISIDDAVEDLHVTIDEPKPQLVSEPKLEVSNEVTSNGIEIEGAPEPNPEPKPFIPIHIASFVPKTQDSCKSCEEIIPFLKTLRGGKENDENDDIFNMSLDLSGFKNRERRAEEKHLAEITNLKVQRQILELDLKIKEQIFNGNKNQSIIN